MLKYAVNTKGMNTNQTEIVLAHCSYSLQIIVIMALIGPPYEKGNLVCPSVGFRS